MTRFKKACAFLTALAVTAVSLFIPTFGAAAEGAGDLVPDWFNEDKRTTWWATVPFEGKDNERFNITVSGGVWTYTQHHNASDFGIAQSWGTTYDLDLSVNPYLNFVTDMVGESAYIKLCCRDENREQKNIEVALIQAGKQTVSVDLTQNYDIMKAAGTDKKLHLYGVVFTTDKFGTNESLSFTNFRFTSKKETNKNDRYWLDPVADYNWYHYDWNISSPGNNKRFEVYHNPEGFLQLKLKWKGSVMKRLNNQYSAKTSAIDGISRWFSADNDGKWWDGNSYGGLTNGGFLINHPNGSWQYNHRWSVTGGSARLDCNGPGLTVDLNETNRVNYTVKASKPIELWVQTYNLKEDGTPDGDTRSFIKLADIAAGETTESVDLLKNSEFVSRLTADKKIHISGFGFYTKSFENGDTIDVTAFSIGERETAQKIDLNTFTRMHYATRYMEKDVKVYLIVAPLNNNGSLNDEMKKTVYVGTIPGNAPGKGYFDLLGNSELLSLAGGGKKLYIKGVELDISAWNVWDEKNQGHDVNISDLSFCMPEEITADCNFTTAGTRILSNSENGTFTVSAAANYSGTDAVKYQWYVDGELKENETRANITLDNSKVGSHTVRSVVTVGDIPYFNTKFFESETYTYGKYIAGNVSMSGELGAEDLTVLRKNILGVNSFDELQTLAADMNNDNEIDIRDLISLKKALAK